MVKGKLKLPMRVRSLEEYDRFSAILSEYKKERLAEYDRRYKEYTELTHQEKQKLHSNWKKGKDICDSHWHMYQCGQILTLEKLKKKEWLTDLLLPLEKELEQWQKQREEAVRYEVREQRQTIEDLRSQIAKLQLAIKLHLGSLNNFEKEARKDWEQNNPFKHKQKLERLRNRLYKI